MRDAPDSSAALTQRRSPLLIGIAGGTGSGKTTIARKIAESLPADGVAIIEHDSYYRDRSGMSFEDRCAINFDHPDALETSLLVEHLSALRRGEDVELPIYDFASHTRSPRTHKLAPSPVIIVEGILVFVDPLLRDLLDIKLFVDTDADVRILRRVHRDIKERERSLESVCHQYHSSVRPMHLQFVEPSKAFSDLIIPEGGNSHVVLDLIVTKARSVIEAANRRTL